MKKYNTGLYYLLHWFLLFLVPFMLWAARFLNATFFQITLFPKLLEHCGKKQHHGSSSFLHADVCSTFSGYNSHYIVRRGHYLMMNLGGRLSLGCRCCCVTHIVLLWNDGIFFWWWESVTWCRKRALFWALTSILDIWDRYSKREKS